MHRVTGQASLGVWFGQSFLSRLIPYRFNQLEEEPPTTSGSLTS